MAPSVSSERAFSSARITISRRRNRLKGDIVEALQYIKCHYHQDLIFREVIDSSVIEKELDNDDIVDVDIDSGEAFGQGEPFSWDDLIADIGDDDENDDEMPVD
jgi:hAT family C-terminal dimerisation region